MEVMERDFEGNFSTDRGDAAESSARCREESGLFQHFLG